MLRSIEGGGFADSSLAALKVSSTATFSSQHASTINQLLLFPNHYIYWFDLKNT